MASDCAHDTANEHCCDGMCCPEECTCDPRFCNGVP